LFLGTLNDSSQISIYESFKKSKSTIGPEEGFTINRFKKLLLSFIINNNISFRAVTTQSFKDFIKYLN
jgi:hypothetical protein